MAKSVPVAKASSNKQKKLALAARRARKDDPPPISIDRHARARAEAEAALAASRREVGRKDIVDRLAAGEALDLPRHSHLVHLRWLFDGARKLGPEVLRAARRLVEALRGAEDLLTARGPDRHAQALLGLALRHARWVRPPEAWVRPSRNARRQLASLLRHTLATWPVPAFFDHAWLDGELVQQGWWIHVASGQNLRTAEGLPFPLTKKAAHHALEAPADLSVGAALRRGQVLALGGDARAAHGVLATRLGRELGQHEDFWETVLRWFVQHPLLDPAQYGPIVDYVREQRFVTPPGQAAPAQPNLCMKGRDPAALLRAVETWHRRLGRARPGVPGAWAPHPRVGEWSHTAKLLDGREVEHAIVQLLTTDDLVVEGRRMSHCVASYAWSCARGDVSIWSLRRIEADGVWTPLVTIELDHRTNDVVQAKAARNEPPSRAAWALVERWVREHRLGVSRWVRA